MQVAVIGKDGLITDSVVSLISAQTGVKAVGGARTVQQAARMVRRGGVLVVVGEGLAVEDWIELGKIKAETSMRVILVQTGAADSVGSSAAEITVQSKDGGDALARAVLQFVKDPGTTSQPSMVRETGVAYGRKGRTLTKREREVVSYMSLGMTNRRIAEILGLQEQSIKNLVSSIMRKLDCQNRTQAILKLQGKPYDSN